MPFDLAYEDVQSPLEIVLQVANDSDLTASVLAWQLEFELRPLNGAHGTLLFYDVSLPVEPLFDQTSEPQCTPELPPASDSVFASDADTTTFVGATISPQTARNILLLTLVASPDAAGAFQFIMREFDPENPNSSSWISADEGFAPPQAFDNSDPSSFAGFVLLGTINVTQIPDVRPGDYDLDGQVTIADYHRWTAGFGTTVKTPGDGADGNRNGIIDAADYVVWRRFLGTNSAADGNTLNSVPEPGTFVLVSLAVPGLVGLFYSRIGRLNRGQQRRSI